MEDVNEKKKKDNGKHFLPSASILLDKKYLSFIADQSKYLYYNKTILIFN